MEMKGLDFIVMGNQPWDVPIGSNCKNIAEVIARDNRVLYVNRPLDLFTLLKNKPEDKDYIAKRQAVRKGETKPIQHIKDGLYTLDPRVILPSINWMPDGFLYDRFLKGLNQQIFQELNWAIKELDFKDFYFFNDSEMFQAFHASTMLEAKLNVYYSRDNLVSTGYFKKHGQRIEPILLKSYDLAVANSLFLKDYCAQFNQHSYYVGQGCDLSIFDPELNHEMPEDLKDIGQPIIGYIGALLKARLDIKLLEDLAEARKDWSFVMVGPEDDHFKASRLHQMDNVYFLGPKKPEELGQYLSFFDVALNPQEVNELTIGNYPRKIDEYLAMGKPTVATPTRAMEIFKDHVYLAEGAKGYEQAISDGLASIGNEEVYQERIRFAQSHSWENSVAAIWAATQGVESKLTKS